MVSVKQQSLFEVTDVGRGKAAKQAATRCCNGDLCEAKKGPRAAPTIGAAGAARSPNGSYMLARPASRLPVACFHRCVRWHRKVGTSIAAIGNIVIEWDSKWSEA